SDRLDPAGNAPDRSRLRTTLAAEDEVLLAADRLSIVPGLRWEVFRDDFPGTPRLPVAARAGGVSVRDFLSPRLGLRLEPVRGRLWGRLGAALNYTHQEARDEGPVTFLRGKALPGRPADEAFAHLELAWSPTRPLPLGRRTAGLWPGRLFYEANVIADDFLDRANVRRVSSRVLHEVGLELALPVPGVRLTLEAKNVGDDRT